MSPRPIPALRLVGCTRPSTADKKIAFPITCFAVGTAAWLVYLISQSAAISPIALTKFAGK